MPTRSSLFHGPQLKRFQEKGVKIGVLHSGGPAPGGNQVLYAASLRAKDHNLPLIVFKQGYQHLMSTTPEEILSKWALPIGQEEIRYLRDQDTLLPGSSRANPGKDIASPEDLKDHKKTEKLSHVLDALEAMQIGALISVGGDDTMRTANLLQKHFENLKASGRIFRHFEGMVHVPKTIDKDYPGIDFTFGFMTASQTIGDRVKALHDDAKATATDSQIVYHVVEIMGRAAGWLCTAASIYGQSTYAIIPEDFFDAGAVTLEVLADNCVDMILTRKKQGKNYGVITIAEGIGDLLPHIDVAKDEYGHTRLDEIQLGFRLRKAIIEELKKRTDIKAKIPSQATGYDARQVKPNIFDALLCQRLGVSAIDAILEGNFGHMISVEGVFCPKIIPFDKLIDPQTLRVESWAMGPDEGLYTLLLGMQQPFESDVDKK